MTDFHALARRWAADPDAWPVAPRFNAAERWYHRLAATDDHEVWLLTWLPGQGTDVHDHGGSAGALHVVSGALVEDTVTLPAAGRAPRVAVRELTAGLGHAFGPRHIHRVTNRSTTPAVSIHVYGPALRSMTRYLLGPAGLAVTSVERAGVQW
ncbi:cysteine dioxygenase [Spirilliplanes yamanashiensis]|uniref:Cysteine dioxygenase n=1 Tax=Spirilliplanes yamanashiensis TaxID=42233 RepID=A0A8J3Y5T1_9ACTN|nr:cysteine dioxygenase family protein [Spirilliplanes yamanashiensis]MDP9819247.1 putative metal-dependent enzyme (double-stranded beta helix superfamily) [Spirilliplanes yamanashiensis]GIJ01929.1 cysteine dioxygenase [Spirilliplanes yamanashiensis]